MELLTPDIGLVFWMLIVFGLLVFLLKKLAWKPIMKALKQREQNIEDALQTAEKTRAEMKQLQFDNEKLLRQAKDERDVMLKEARAVKDSIIEDAKIKANEEADRIIVAAKESIHFEKLAAITGLKNQMAKISIDIAEKVLIRELSDSEAQKRLVEQELDKVKL